MGASGAGFPSQDQVLSFASISAYRRITTWDRRINRSKRSASTVGSPFSLSRWIPASRSAMRSFAASRRWSANVRSVSLSRLIILRTHALSRRSCGCRAMNESSSCPHFGCCAVLALDQENFQLNGRGYVIVAVEDERAPDSPIAIAEIAAIFRHCPGSLVLRETGPLHQCCRSFRDLYLR
jgi:hypothetical protein